MNDGLARVRAAYAQPLNLPSDLRDFARLSEEDLAAQEVQVRAHLATWTADMRRALDAAAEHDDAGEAYLASISLTSVRHFADAGQGAYKWLDRLARYRAWKVGR